MRSSLVFGQQVELTGFRLGAGCRRDRNMLEGDAVERGQLFDVAMVGDDEGNVAAKLAGVPALQQVGHAVQVLGAEQGQARAAGAGGEAPVHVEFGGQFSVGAFEGRKIEGRGRGRAGGQFPLHAHEEEAQLVVAMLVRMQDIGAVGVEHGGDARDEALAVGAIDQQNG